jgi:hypothetical protein
MPANDATPLPLPSPVPDLPVPPPSSYPTSMLPPSEPPAAHVVLSERLALLAHDVRMGYMSDTDQAFLTGVLRAMSR